MMRALRTFGTIAAILVIGGCLVSREPVLDEANGKATPLAAGSYKACPVDEGEEDCARLNVTIDETGLYTMVAEDNAADITKMRMRRIARNGFAVQAFEVGGQGFGYFHARPEDDDFLLTMLMCDQLPEKLRRRLIKKKELVAEAENFEFCTVGSVSALKAAAKAYHREAGIEGERFAFRLSPAQSDPAE